VQLIFLELIEIYRDFYEREAAIQIISDSSNAFTHLNLTDVKLKPKEKAHRIEEEVYQLNKTIKTLQQKLERLAESDKTQKKAGLKMRKNYLKELQTLRTNWNVVPEDKNKKRLS
jgi:uncharacterized protein YlxW (UPF0749 family)